MANSLARMAILASSILSPTVLALPQGYPSRPLHVPRQEATSNYTSTQRANAVKDAFQFAWDGYYEYAYPHDDLSPVSHGYTDPRNGWGASAVDALSTATIMELKPVVDVILEHISEIDYGYTNTTCSLFETTIRYLGGMLAGYDLLTGPFTGLASNESNVAVLLDQSVNLANVLKFAFNTTTGIPVNDLWITNQTQQDDVTNSIAGFGTLVLEWTHLSDLTGDTEYANLSQTAEQYLLNPQPATSEPFPGLVGTTVTIDTGLFADANGGWQGSDDSFYEYLIKMYVYDSSRFEYYKDRWVTAVESSMEYLASRPSSRPDLLFLAEFEGTQTINTSEHLACFDGGNFILGGTVLGRQDIVDFGLELVNGCHDTYISTETGIGPEIFSWNTSTIPAGDEEFYEENGFYIVNAEYITRPEVIESFYYAYRATGNTTYQDWAWDAFVAINATCRTDVGFSSISDVNAPGGGTKLDDQESFLFAEVMKYSYIIHAEDGPWQVENDGVNMFVFNTEAHPMRVAGTPI